MGFSKRTFEFVSRPWSFWLLEKTSPLAGRPLVRKIFPYFKKSNLNISCLPINEDIALPENTPLPVQVLEDFIRRANHRVIVDYCACRKTNECKRYPYEVGCLMMGKAALQISPEISREVTVEEALEHVRWAVGEGLIPFTGKARIDNLVFGIRDNGHLLSTCFCCECCCISRFARAVPPAMRVENVVKLDGLSVEVTDSCDGCGACAKRCFLQEITIVDGRAVIGEGCAGCGRCATVCKRDAVRISLDNPEFLTEATSRIEALIDIG